MRIGYRGPEGRTVLIEGEFTPEDAAHQVALANRAEQGENLSGLAATRPPRATGTVWFAVHDAAMKETV